MKPIVAGLILASSIGLSQSAAPAFEVASVKFYAPRPDTPPFTGTIRPQVSGNRVSFVASTQDLVAFAYNLLDERQISGPRAGLYEFRVMYDIEAVAPGEGSPSMDQIRLMTQTLLADRFQLKMHPRNGAGPGLRPGGREKRVEVEAERRGRPAFRAE